MPVKVTYFVHGTTTDNLAHKSTGWNPGVLSDKGIMQGVELAKTIKEQYFDVVFSSDLTRSIESAKLNFYNRDIKIKTTKKLRECNYGDLNGQDEHLVVYADHIELKFPNGENLKNVESRIRKFCVFLKENYYGKSVAIVAHKAPQLAFEVICNKKTWEEALATDWRNTKSWQPGWTYVIK